MNSALIVIDVQKIYTSRGSELFCKDVARTLERINQLIAAFEAAHRPIFLIRHVHKRDGSDLGRMFDFSEGPEDDFNFKDGDDEVEYDHRLHHPGTAIEITKTRYSAFTGTKLESMLLDMGVQKVVICGFMTNFCCESTSRYAHDADYYVDFIPDATGTPGTENLSQVELRRTVSESIEAGIGRILSTKRFLSTWDGR